MFWNDDKGAERCNSVRTMCRGLSGRGHYDDRHGNGQEREENLYRGKRITRQRMKSNNVKHDLLRIVWRGLSEGSDFPDGQIAYTPTLRGDGFIYGKDKPEKVDERIDVTVR